MEIIVGQYNRIVTCLHPVERPLIQSRIDKMNQVLNDGLVSIKWEDEGLIFEFVKGVKDYVQSVTNTVDVMKASLDKINSKLENDVKETICKHTPIKKAKNPEDYLQEWQAAMVDRWNSVKGNYKEIIKALKEIGDQIRVNKASKEWNHYREYINDIVIIGQVNAIYEALRRLLKRIEYDPEKHFER